MGKFIGLVILWQILGNPIAAILVLLVILYLLDRRFIGLSPSITRPIKRLRNISNLRKVIAASPSDVSSRHELARLLLERKKYGEALQLLESIKDSSEESAEYWDDLGTARLFTGDIPNGEQDILRGLSLNSRVKYGRPYLRLAEAYRTRDKDKALHYLEQFHDIHSSSSEAYYLLGSMYRTLGREDDAKKSFKESLQIYRALPKYKRRQERRWALKSYFRSIA
ncbi:tetratricopeptide repeat protein [Paenibacillus campinasensis]|uniref:Tetratricopeptide repeat protein n=1 Tax=Paenibacillus campinasensis TaxID=66347 RepID=A0ABW9SZJ9_9BACL|nr:tetratricopeptide repeat protein [Paenibacillus campinasensis]